MREILAERYFDPKGVGSRVDNGLTGMLRSGGNSRRTTIGPFADIQIWGPEWQLFGPLAVSQLPGSNAIGQSFWKSEWFNRPAALPAIFGTNLVGRIFAHD
jgi:hypothetical protein